MNAVLGRGTAEQSAHAALITDSRLAALAWDGRAIVAGVETDAPFRLGHDLALHQLPAPGGTVTRLFGMADDPKRHWADATATYLNRPWPAWLAAAQVEPSLLWPHVPPAAWNLWNARLFPLLPDRDESLRLALALQDPSQAGAAWRAHWAASPRLSLAEGFAQADGEQILAEIAALEDEVITRRALVCLEREQPATELAALLHSHTSDILARRGQRVAARLADADPVLQWRGYRALAVAAGEPAWEERAFAVLAHQIETTVTQQQPGTPAPAASPLPVGTAARVETAARIDFGGGWTDTPPYSLERGGTVLNAAILLDGSYPIVVEGAWLPEPRILLESLDIGETLEPATVGEIYACANPADPFALLKAALLLKGIVPANSLASTPVATALAPWPGGVRLRTQTTIPRGSGLGTSSILAGAVLACLDRLLGLPPSQARLFDEVLWLEQMLTTGGGWQDQAGGLVGGIKLVTTAPALHQTLAVEPLVTTAATADELAERLMLVYTGQQRLAKNLLRAVMSRWMLRDPEMVWLLGEIGRLAVSMRDALAGGDVDGFGEMVGAHWELNKRMDPGCTNPFIDDLFAFMRPYMRGAKLAGAGGGGFAIVVANRDSAAQALHAALDAHYAGTPVRVWPHAIPTAGIRIT
jgi:fucokinase